MCRAYHGLRQKGGFHLYFEAVWGPREEGTKEYWFLRHGERSSSHWTSWIRPLGVNGLSEADRQTITDYQTKIPLVRSQDPSHQDSPPQKEARTTEPGTREEKDGGYSHRWPRPQPSEGNSGASSSRRNWTPSLQPAVVEGPPTPPRIAEETQAVKTQRLEEERKRARDSDTEAEIDSAPKAPRMDAAATSEGLSITDLTYQLPLVRVQLHQYRERSRAGSAENVRRMNSRRDGLTRRDLVNHPEVLEELTHPLQFLSHFLADLGRYAPDTEARTPLLTPGSEENQLLPDAGNIIAQE